MANLVINKPSFNFVPDELGYGSGDKGYNYLVRAWINGKYIEIGRDFDGESGLWIPSVVLEETGEAHRTIQAIMKAMPNQKSAQMTQEYYKYKQVPWGANGQTVLERKSLPTVTINITDYYAPHAPTIIPTGINTFKGMYLQGISGVILNVECAGSYGSTITGTSITANGSTTKGQNRTINVIDTSGTFKFSANCTDSRGFKTVDGEGQITVVSYTKPTISAFTPYRCNSGGTANEDGTYLAASYTCGYNTLGGNNAVSVKLEYFNGTTWTQAATSTSTSGIIRTTRSILSSTADTQVRLTVTDSVGQSISRVATVPMSFRLMSGDKKSIAFGKESSYSGKFEVHMPMSFEGNLEMDDTAKKGLIDIVHPVGTAMWLQYGKSPSTLFPGTTWVEHTMVLSPTKNLGFGIAVKDGRYANSNTLIIYDKGNANGHNTFAIYPMTTSNTIGTRLVMWIRTS